MVWRQLPTAVFVWSTLDFHPSKPTPKPTPNFWLTYGDGSILPVSEAGDLGSIPSARTRFSMTASSDAEEHRSDDRDYAG